MLKAYQLDKDPVLPKKMLKSLSKQLQSTLHLSRVDSIVTQSSLSQEGPRTCQVSLEGSNLVDYVGNTAL